MVKHGAEVVKWQECAKMKHGLTLLALLGPIPMKTLLVFTEVIILLLPISFSLEFYIVPDLFHLLFSRNVSITGQYK